MVWLLYKLLQDIRPIFITHVAEYLWPGPFSNCVFIQIVPLRNLQRCQHKATISAESDVTYQYQNALVFLRQQLFHFYKCQLFGDVR